jgi:hypothetical protein
MKRLLVVATVVAAAVSLGVLAALVVGPSPARSVPAIELVTTSSTAPATPTAADGAGERAASGRPGQDDGPATSPREPGGGGASPAPAPPPAPAGGGGGDDDGDDGDDDDGDGGGDD